MRYLLAGLALATSCSPAQAVITFNVNQVGNDVVTTISGTFEHYIKIP